MEKDQIILLEQLFNRYFSHLVLYSRKLIGAQEPAEDIVQDVFLHLYDSFIFIYLCKKRFFKLHKLLKKEND